ncbi:hypothetical protein [uncultured Thermomonospora sp.]|uniref:hypothetical protein n=1 Tax=uncultured Thermomonospora sp. TaxID=671175 RepID=UPI00259B1AAC|nr:hypothetical protein [uncultured Thermomonospora sp.]
MLGTMSRTFTAQEIREALSDYGFMPLTRINKSEHWVRGSRRVILVFDGDYPEKVEAEALHYATAIDRGDWIELSF